jgi:hypothetical protein
MFSSLELRSTVYVETESDSGFLLMRIESRISAGGEENDETTTKIEKVFRQN